MSLKEQVFTAAIKNRSEVGKRVGLSNETVPGGLYVFAGRWRGVTVDSGGRSEREAKTGKQSVEG